MCRSEKEKKQLAVVPYNTKVCVKMDILQTLSVVSVIWIMAAGVLIFALLFLFAKRQIMRFTLKSRGCPYVSIGSEAPTELRQEIMRRLNRIQEIKHEPLLLNPMMEQYATSGENHFYFRMKAMDDFTMFDDIMKKEHASRHPAQTMRNYLTTIYPTYLSTAPTEVVNQFIDLYEHARHKPDIFDDSHYQKYVELLNDLIQCLHSGIKMKKDLSIAEMSKPQMVDTEVRLKSLSKGISIGKTKTTIPYNHMVSDKHSSRGQTRYRTRASSSEQAGLLESGPSSQRSSVEVLVPAIESSEENIHLVKVDMNTMPVI